MRIATYNVNGVNGRLPVLLRWLEETKPDIVCLQELKSPGEKFPEKAILDAGYQAIWHGQKSWNGVAILSRKEKILEVSSGVYVTSTELKLDTVNLFSIDHMARTL